MASINDVYNQLVAVNGSLGQIHADGVAETNATNQVRASVDHLDNDVKAGFTATVNAINTLALIEIEEAKLLFHLTQQADTMICALEQIARNTCGILDQVTIQTQLQTRIRDDADVLRDIEESENPGAVLQRQRLAELQAQIEKCCPPEQPEPPCVYEPCPQPRPAEPPRLPKIDIQPPKDNQPPG